MKITVIHASTGKIVAAEIRDAKQIELPSMQSGWRFNFNKHIKTLPRARAFVLTTVDTPEIVEGCLIFQMMDSVVPYMAFVETAAHNRGDGRRLGLVAECLIAYACRLSFIHGEEHYKGWLTFDVCVEHKKDSDALMGLYCRKYRAVRFGETTMLIQPEDGEVLIQTYLSR
jgi:hypothetical protein